MDEANSVIAELQDPGRHPVQRHDLLAAIAALNPDRHDEAFDQLDRAFDERNALMLWIGSYFIFDPLRADPRFDRLLNRMGIEPSQ